MPAVLIDWDDTSTYRPFLRAARTLVLIMPTMTDQVERTMRLVEVAADLNVPQIIKVSTIGATATRSKIDRAHNEVDERLAAVDAATTLIRVAPVMEGWLGRTPVDGTYDGATSIALPYVDARDLAWCIAHWIDVLSDETFTVTGSVAHTPEAMAAIIADVIGRPTRYRRIDESELWTRFADHGVPAERADWLVEHHRATEALAPAQPTPDLERVLGRRPTGFAQFVTDHRSTFETHLRR